LCTITYTDGNTECNSDCDGDCDSDGNSYTHAHGDSDTDTVRRKVYADTAASSHSAASPIAPVAASLREAETWNDCKRG
jgi:hypothetical protein